MFSISNMAIPILSIVVPTREGFSEYWLKEFLQIKGEEVELILVHPPGMKKSPDVDPRLKQINSSFRGEIIQRMTGLINVTGTYILTINCDEYLNPNILDIAVKYFSKYPDSWVLRLKHKNFAYGDIAGLEAAWENPPDIDELKICSRAEGSQNLYKENKNYMIEIPIAPLDNKFDVGCLYRGRKDHHGYHTENFDKKVWKTQMVQAALKDIGEAMILFGPIKYVPFWCLDRLLGLFVQAKFYEKGKVIGHLLPEPEQIRSEDNPPENRRTKRFYVFAEILLLKHFPQYGYLWNLILHQTVEIPVRAFDSIKRKLLK